MNIMKKLPGSIPLKEMKAAVIVPTFNNAAALPGVLNELLLLTDKIIVVNDGSTDTTSLVLKDYSDRITVTGFQRNRGKGAAIKHGFITAGRLGYSLVVTIDSDGQHNPADIPVLLDVAVKNPGSIIIGSRNLRQTNMPGGNTFANKFSNFWFRIQTLSSLPDTQSGFRVYPLNKVGKIRLLTSRYETELELLVRAAWKGINTLPVPVNVYYPPAGERVSHFRPFTDFFRISLLNSVLCLLAVIWGYPSMLFHKILAR